MGPGPFWAGAEDLADTGIRSLGCRPRSDSLYERYRGPRKIMVVTYSMITRWDNVATLSLVMQDFCQQ